MFDSKKKIIAIIAVIGIFISVYYLFFSKKENKNEFEEFYTEEQNIEETKDKDNIKNNIIVHIMGEVQKEGIIEIEEGKRIADAIDRAGGLTENADITNINLAFALEDGMKIIIPSKENSSLDANENMYIIVGAGENVISSSNNKGGEVLVNINTASQEELESLPGIGSAIALRIISYRQEKGKFSSIEDIKNVSGIGENKFNKIKELICI